MIFLVPAALIAQELKWDAALGQYQRICDECIMLRIRSASGVSINASEVQTLLSRLASLRETLQSASGQMTPAQRLRFQSIRLRYEEVFGQSSMPRISSLEPAPELPFTVKALSSNDFVPAGAIHQHKSPPAHVGMILLAGAPDLSFGAMATLSGLRFGGFLKASASIPFTSAAYDCFSDGTTPTGYIWTTGGERISRWAVTAGAMFALRDFLSVYAGAGYGSRALLWQDVSSRWARVGDRSVSGVAADAGLVFNFGKFSLLAGVSSLGLGAFNAEFGAGVRF